MKTQTEEKRMVAFRPIYLAAAIVGCLSLAGCPDFNLLDKQYPGDVRTHDTGQRYLTMLILLRLRLHLMKKSRVDKVGAE